VSVIRPYVGVVLFLFISVYVSDKCHSYVITCVGGGSGVDLVLHSHTRTRDN
jgi:hypothetical protein